MNYNQLVAANLGKCIDIDGNGYRCTDTPKLRLHYCDGYSINDIMILGNPVDYIYTIPKKFPKFKYYLTNDKQLNAGDILVAPKLWIMLNWKRTGHTALFDSYWPWTTINVFEQNWVGGTNGMCGKGNEHRLKNYPFSTFTYFITDKELKTINPKKAEYKENPDFSLSEFVERLDGKFIDVDGIGGAVCNDPVKLYHYERWNIPIPFQSGKYFYTGNFARTYGFEVIKLDEKTLPTLQAGDTLFLDKGVGLSGHIGICTGVELNFWGSGMDGIRSFEQNGGGNWECRKFIREAGVWDWFLRKI